MMGRYQDALDYIFSYVNYEKKARYPYDAATFDLAALANASEGFSGAEIEQAIVSGLYAAHAAGAPLSDFTLRGEVRATRPLSVVMGERVAALRDWAQGRTVPAD
jgi:hypothetical protein